MGLLFPAETSVNFRAEQEAAFFHRMGCKICPLSGNPGRMEPTGAKHPLVYVLGEAPGEEEVKKAKQFIGSSGNVLRRHIPEEMLPRIRWNNVVRSRCLDDKKKNKTPERPEIESCRPSIIADIEQSQPKAIFGFGNVPLTWVSGFTRITDWRGRRMPVKVGSHVCWYYAMLHPAYLLHATYGVDEAERMFELDLKKAFDDVLDLPEPAVHDSVRVNSGVSVITAVGKRGVQEIADALAWAKQQSAVGVDYETNCIRPYSKGAKILSAAVGTAKRSFAFPFEHSEAKFTQDEQEDILGMWLNFLQSPVRKFVHNLSFELEWSAMFDPEILHAPGWEDTATQASILDERRGKKTHTGGPFSLEFLVQQHFGFNIKQLSTVDRKNMEAEPLAKILPYNALDAKYHLLLGLEQEALIKAEGLDYVYDLARRRIPAVVMSQLKGIPVDQEAVKLLQDKYSERIKGLEKNIAAVPVVKQLEKQQGEPYNPKSNPETLEIFHKLLKRRECLVKDKYSGKMRYSCDEEILAKIDHPLSNLLVEYRHAQKRKGTYIDVLATGSSIVYSGSFIHCNYNTYFAETGRTSCDDPNIQNWPKRDDEGKETRRPIACKPNQKILAFDYGQIQARIVAMFSKDKTFCKALWERYDIHQEWTERLAKAYPSRIGGRKMLTDKKAMKDFRTDIKNQWTFPLLFGAKLESVAGYLKIPEDVVKPHYKEFWRQFSEVAAWQERLIKFYQEYGYVECLTGRRRHGPLSLNKIINSPVQGTEAEIVCDGWSRLFETKRSELCPEIMVHDDLTFVSVDEEGARDIAKDVLNILLDVKHFKWINVPITVELSAGKNWMPYDKKNNPDGLEELGSYSSDEWFGK